MTTALQRLLVWLSPAFPAGGFAWSQGLETAIVDGRIRTSADVQEWLSGLLAHGGMRTDAIIVAHAHRRHADPAQLQELSDLALALTSAGERALETTLLGEAFAAAARAWPSDVFGRLPSSCPYPIAVGAIAAAQGIGPVETIAGYLTGAIQTQVSVAVRLVPLGQAAGLDVVSRLEPVVTAMANAAASAGLDAIGGIAYAHEIAQMRHETLESRIFRS